MPPAPSPPPSKKAHLALETPDPSDSASSSSSSDDDSVSGEDAKDGDSDQEEEFALMPANADKIQVEFEARCAEDGDFGGIRRQLGITFSLGGLVSEGAHGMKSEDVDRVTRYVMDQRCAGSVIVQSLDGPLEEEEDEEDEDDDMVVYGVTSIVRITKDIAQENVQMASGMRDFLVKHCQADDKKYLEGLLHSTDNCVGFIISERVINIPPQISVPLYETLFNEIRKAKAKQLPFAFTHFVMVSRRHVLVHETQPDEIPGGVEGPADNLFVNPEEETVQNLAERILDVHVAPGAEPGQSFVNYSNRKYQAVAKILVFRADVSDRWVNELKGAFPLPE